MPRTLFWLQSTLDIWVADGTHQTSMRSPLTKLLSPQVVPIIVPQLRKKNWCTFSVIKKWQLARRWRLLQSACQPGTSQSVHWGGNHCAHGRECREGSLLCHSTSAVTSNKSVGCIGHGDFHLFGSRKKNLAIKRFALDADVKRAVSY